MDLFANVPLILPDADLRYLPHWLEAPLASAWLLRLEQETPWEQPILRIHGEAHPTPRLVAWYGDPEAAYRYSGQVHRPLHGPHCSARSANAWNARSASGSTACC